MENHITPKPIASAEFLKALNTVSNYYKNIQLNDASDKIPKELIDHMEELSECYQNVYGTHVQINQLLTGSNSNLYPTLDLTEQSSVFEEKEKEHVDNIHKLGDCYKKLLDVFELEEIIDYQYHLSLEEPVDDIDEMERKNYEQRCIEEEMRVKHDNTINCILISLICLPFFYLFLR